MDKPEQWAVELCILLNIPDYEALTIQRAFEERERVLRDAVGMALEWIDAIPDEIAATLPAMPGFDRDSLNDTLAALKDKPC